MSKRVQEFLDSCMGNFMKEEREAAESIMRNLQVSCRPAHPLPRKLLSLLVTVCKLQGGAAEGVEAGGEGSVMH